MSFDLKRYFVILCLGISIILNVSIWIFLLVKVSSLGEEVFLHYDASQGIDLIGSPQQFYILPLSGLVIIAVNFFLSALSIKINRFAAQVLSGLAVAGQIILLVAAILMVSINL